MVCAVENAACKQRKHSDTYYQVLWVHLPWKVRGRMRGAEPLGTGT